MLRFSVILRKTNVYNKFMCVNCRSEPHFLTPRGRSWQPRSHLIYCLLFVNHVNFTSYKVVIFARISELSYLRLGPYYTLNPTDD
jgi:hypothetical protein